MIVRGLILVVEDNEDIRESLIDNLKEEGYRAQGAYNAAEALDYLATQLPALIIVDLGLPGMDGFELIEEIRKNSRLVNVPIFLMTGFAGRQVTDRAAQLGIHYILKPLDLVCFLKLVEETIGKPASE